MTTKNNEINVVITCTWRFECLNIILDILKKNNKKNIITHVFCNLDEKTYLEFKNEFDYDNIDYFYHLPDAGCNKNTKGKIEVRRRQPLDFFIKVMYTLMDKSDITRFIYTECDVFPVDIEKYIKHLEKVNPDNICAGKIIKKDLVSSKTPEGYLCMSPLYFYNNRKTINHLIDNLIKNREKYINNNYAFEGMICESFSNIKSKVVPTSNYFISNYEYTKNLDPPTMTTHQHNPLNIKYLLKKRNIISGKHIEILLRSDEIEETFTQNILTIDIDENIEIKLQEKKLQ